jgi:hypothetical protein
MRGHFFLDIAKPRRPTVADAIFPHALYDQIIEQTIGEIRKLGTLKGGEYAGDVDRLANFRRNGKQLDLPMETVWAVYYNKHHDSVMQYIQDLKNAKQRTRLEGIEGRVDDMLTYLMLFKCILRERAENTDLRGLPPGTQSSDYPG